MFYFVHLENSKHVNECSFKTSHASHIVSRRNIHGFNLKGWLNKLYTNHRRFT